MKQQYWVDWDDSSYPAIREWVDGCEGEPKPLSEAKAEIVNHFQYEIEHARAIIAKTRSLRPRDLKDSDATQR